MRCPCPAPEHQLTDPRAQVQRLTDSGILGRLLVSASSSKWRMPQQIRDLHGLGRRVPGQPRQSAPTRVIRTLVHGETELVAKTSGTPDSGAHTGPPRVQLHATQATAPTSKSANTT